MATASCAFDPSIQHLADGFELLRQEYVSLAIRYRQVDAQLRATKEQYDKLASLAPEHAKSAQPQACPFNRTRSDQLPSVEEILADPGVGTTGESGPILETYQKANEAYHKARSRRSTPPLINEPQQDTMATNFTGSNFVGSGCPFSSVNGTPLAPISESKDMEDAYIQLKKSRSASHSAQDLADARSQMARSVARSHARSNSRRPITPAESTASGPVCPIRFMDKHSPEDIAAYFEEHKHELPRSHEICVKRFQSNAESLKQLDEKYGNLVAMIQGLGQKHKPMLPENPEGEEFEDEEPIDDRKRDEKIEAWSKAVSSSSNVVETGATTVEAAETSRAKGDGIDERVGHFDRPLKDIRVGESPSRPWGVPIPSKYLDLENDEESVSSIAKKVDETLVNPSTQAATQKDEELPSKTKGKCPFDHTKLAALQGKEKSGGDIPPPILPHHFTKPAPVADHAPAQPPRDVKAAAPVQAPEDDLAATGHIVNYGVAIVSPSKSWKSAKITNYGTLFLANSSAHAGQMLQSTLNNAK